MTLNTNKRAKPPQTGKSMVRIFEKCQHAESKHEALLTNLKELQDKFTIEQFSVKFNACLLEVLSAHMNTLETKNSILFVVKFLARKAKEEDDDEQEYMGPFLQSTFDFIWKVQGVDVKNIRYHACLLLNQFLSMLAKMNTCLDNDLCTKMIKIIIAERITDKVPMIREMAVKVLQWLQDDTDAQCIVTKTMMFHMDRDPSFEVRRAVLKCIRVSSNTLSAVIRRTNDVKDVIRKDAYGVIAERVKMCRLTLSSKEHILHSGLTDSSEIVLSEVESHLLPKWLLNHDNNIISFLHSLDAETTPAVPELVLPFIFKSKPIDELVKVLDIPEGFKTVPLENLTPQLALYWRCLALFLYKQPENEEACKALESLLPPLSQLCIYIGSYFDTPVSVSDDNNPEVELVIKFSTLEHLIGLVDSSDLCDELGRNNLRKLIDRLLLDPGLIALSFIAKVAKILDKAIPDPIQRIDAVVNLIDDIHNPQVPRQKEAPQVLSVEKRRELRLEMAKKQVRLANLIDEQEKAISAQNFGKAEELKEPINELRAEIEQMNLGLQHAPPIEEMEREELWTRPVLAKCLTILNELMRNPEITPHCGSLLDTMECFVKKCVSIMDDSQIMTMAVESLGLYMLLDVTYAKSNIKLLYAMLSSDAVAFFAVREMCVKCISAVLVQYGLKVLDIPDDEPVFIPERAKKHDTSVQANLSYITSITYLLDDSCTGVRNAAVTAVCQLLLASRVSSPQLLGKLILMWFSPTSADSSIVQKTLGTFFPLFAARVHNACELLQKCLLPTLEVLQEAPHSSPLVEIDMREVGFFILDMARPGKNEAYKRDNINPHDEIAAILIQEIIDGQGHAICSLLLKLLVNLEISYSDTKLCKDFLQQVELIKQEKYVDSKNKDIDKFILRLSNCQLGDDETESDRNSIITASNMENPVHVSETDSE